MSWNNEKMKHMLAARAVNPNARIIVGPQPSGLPKREIYDYSKKHEYKTKSGWLDIQEISPILGQKVIIKAEIWRHGTKRDEEEIETEFIGWNGATSHPMFDYDTHEEFYIKAKFWKPATDVTIWIVDEVQKVKELNK